MCVQFLEMLVAWWLMYVPVFIVTPRTLSDYDFASYILSCEKITSSTLVCYCRYTGMLLIRTKPYLVISAQCKSLVLTSRIVCSLSTIMTALPKPITR